MTYEQNDKLWSLKQGAMASIAELVEALRAATDDDSAYDAARDAIEQDVLSVRVRSDWRNVGEPDTSPTEYELLITTGGPAVRIRGELDSYGEPRRAWLQVQGWGTPWTDYAATDEDVLLDYARCFYFGE